MNSPGKAFLFASLLSISLLAAEAGSDADFDIGVRFTEELILPYGEGNPHLLTRAYNNASHKRYPDSDERFALDFAAPGCSGFRSEVLAPLSGRVSIGDSSGGKGKNVLIEREDGLVCRLAHLDEIRVQEGERVARGEVVGLEGNSGGVTGKACAEHPGTHIHLACYIDGEGVRPEPISGYRNLESRVSQSLTAAPPPAFAAAGP